MWCNDCRDNVVIQCVIRAAIQRTKRAFILTFCCVSGALWWWLIYSLLPLSDLKPFIQTFLCVKERESFLHQWASLWKTGPEFCIYTFQLHWFLLLSLNHFLFSFPFFKPLFFSCFLIFCFSAFSFSSSCRFSSFFLFSFCFYSFISFFYLFLCLLHLLFSFFSASCSSSHSSPFLFSFHYHLFFFSVCFLYLSLSSHPSYFFSFGCYLQGSPHQLICICLTLVLTPPPPSPSTTSIYLLLDLYLFHPPCGSISICQSIVPCHY